MHSYRGNIFKSGMPTNVMLFEGTVVAVIVASLAIIHKTDSAEAVVTPFTELAVDGWSYLVNVVAARAETAGRVVIRFLGNVLAALLSIAAGLVYEFLVWLGEGAVYLVQTYGPVVKEKAIEHGSRALRWTADTLQMLAEELWKLMILSKDRTQEAIERALE